MFSDNSNLNDFVDSIPLCQPEFDLGSILNIFKHTNCDLVAVPLKNNVWGTISSKSLLAFVSHIWQVERIALNGHPKSGTTQIGFFPLSAEDLSSLIQPAIAYPASIKVQEFLSSLYSSNNNFFAENDQTEYLLVDSLGNLKGKLDRSKILRFLATKVNQAPGQQESDPASPDGVNSDVENSVPQLLDSIALPLKIEGTQGKYSYYNRLWQELMGISHNSSSTKQQQIKPLPDTAIANWWLERQSHLNQEGFTSTYQPVNKSHLSCCSKASLFDTGVMPLQSKINLGLQRNLTSTVANHHAAKNTEKVQLSSPAKESQLNIQVEQESDWNYIKIPLTLMAPKSSVQESSHQATDKPLYWLTLAIQSNKAQPSSQLNSVQLNNLATPISNLLASKLLKTVSHELKSPLTGIMGLSSLLKGQQLGKLNQRQLQYIQLIHLGGQKLMGIVHDLIELTKLSTDHYKVQLELVELKPLCHQLYQQVLTRLKIDQGAEPNLLAQDLRLQLDIEPELEVVVADKLCLSTILFHLIWEILIYLESAQIEPHESALQIKVENYQSGISVKISIGSNQSYSFLEAFGLPNQSSGLNLVLAQYLAQATQAEVNSAYFVHGCQLTLSVADQTDSASKPRILQRQEVKTPEQCGLIDQPAGVISQLASQLSSDNTKLPSKLQQQNLTILCLYPEPEVIDSIADQRSDLDFNLKNWAEQNWFKVNQNEFSYQYRIIEADGLDQAHTLARIWQLDIILLDGYQIVNPVQYLRSLQKSEYLAVLPIVTLDARTTEAANQVEGLNVYPCLLPTACRSVQDLMQVIQIATETET